MDQQQFITLQKPIRSKNFKKIKTIDGPIRAVYYGQKTWQYIKKPNHSIIEKKIYSIMGRKPFNISKKKINPRKIKLLRKSFNEEFQAH